MEIGERDTQSRPNFLSVPGTLHILMECEDDTDEEQEVLLLVLALALHRSSQ